MAQVKVYPGALDYVDSDIVMMVSGYEEFFQSELEAKGLRQPPKYFSVTEDNINKHGYTLSKYISYKYNHAVNPLLRDGFGDQIHFFERWESLVFAFNTQSLENFLKRPKALRQVQNPFFPQYEAVVRLLTLFSRWVVLPMLDCSPFFGRERNEIRPPWYREAVNWRKELNLFLLDWEKFVGLHLLKPDSDLHALAIYTKGQISAWSAFEKLVVEDKCYQFSSYLFGLANLHYERGNLVVSLLCLHRSVDMYLQYCGLDSRVMQTSAGGIRYNSSLERISINSSLKLLVANGRLVSDVKRDKDLDNLNADRNMLVLTHSVYGVKADIVKKYLQMVETWITNADGGPKWSKIRRYWFPLPSLDPNVLFDVETSLDTYIREVSFVSKPAPAPPASGI